MKERWEVLRKIHTIASGAVNELGGILVMPADTLTIGEAGMIANNVIRLCNKIHKDLNATADRLQER